MQLMVVVADLVATLVETAVLLHMNHFPLHLMWVIMAVVDQVVIILVVVLLVLCVFCGQEDLVLSHQQT
jgi:hypothetical protein